MHKNLKFQNILSLIVEVGNIISKHHIYVTGYELTSSFEVWKQRSKYSDTPIRQPGGSLSPRKHL